LKLPTVRGNHDRWIAERPREKLGRTMGYEYDQLLPAQRMVLGALPATLQLDGADILAVHGTPTDDETFCSRIASKVVCICRDLEKSRRAWAM